MCHQALSLTHQLRAKGEKVVGPTPSYDRVAVTDQGL